MDAERIVAAQQLLALYCHVADEVKFEPIDAPVHGRLAEVFTEDAVFDATELGLPLFDGLAAISALFARPWPQHPPSHTSGTTYVFEADGELRARSKWNNIDWDGWPRLGEYDDRFRQTRHGLRIRRRVVRQLWNDDGRR